MKNPILIAVSNQKGGVGKSSLTVLLSSYLDYECGMNIAVVDCDTLQHSISRMRTRDMQTIEKSDYYKQLIVSQWERTKRKAYPVIEATPERARDTIDELMAQRPGLDIVFVDLPGSVTTGGIFTTIVNMDYVLTPIVADRMIMQSSLSFSTAVIDYLAGRQNVPLKNFLFVWNKVDRRVSTEVFDAYNLIMQRLNLHVLDCVIPESKRFDKELSVAGGRSFFRCTLLPPPARLLKGSNIDILANELCKLVKINHNE